MANEYSQNSFSRVAGNDAKMGYFPTDLRCVDMIATHFKKVECKEFYCLDPCCGEGDALIAFSKAIGATPIGAELHKERAKAAREKGIEVVEGNFIESIVTLNSFPVCFLNPPYGTEAFTNNREELLFLQKVTGLLTKEGYLVYVIPEYIIDDELLKYIISRYEILEALRFPEWEYKKYKQVALVMKRIPANVPSKKEVEEAVAGWQSLITELTALEEGIHMVEPVALDRLKTFHMKEFNIEQAVEHSLWMLEHTKSAFLSDSIKVEDVSRIDVGQPLMDLKPDLKYLMMAAGVCHGKIAEGTPYEHLQRGTVSVVEESSYDEESGEGSVHTRAKITMKILERNGEFHALM